MGENPRLSAKAMKFTQCRPALLLAGQDKNPQEKKRPEWPMKVPTDFRGIEEAKNKKPTVGSGRTSGNRRRAGGLSCRGS
jgi:hypothetical protein